MNIINLIIISSTLYFGFQYYSHYCKLKYLREICDNELININKYLVNFYWNNKNLYKYNPICFTNSIIYASWSISKTYNKYENCVRSLNEYNSILLSTPYNNINYDKLYYILFSSI